MSWPIGALTSVRSPSVPMNHRVMLTYICNRNKLVKPNDNNNSNNTHITRHIYVYVFVALVSVLLSILLGGCSSDCLVFEGSPSGIEIIDNIMHISIVFIISSSTIIIIIITNTNSKTYIVHFNSDYIHTYNVIELKNEILSSHNEWVRVHNCYCWIVCVCRHYVHTLNGTCVKMQGIW